MSNDPFQIGHRFPFSDYLPSPRGVLYEYREGYHFLFLSEPDCSPASIDAIQRGEILLALADFPPHVLVVALKVLGELWQDTFSTWHMTQPQEARVLPPEVGEKEHIPLLLVLVESTTEHIVARRGIRLPPRFGKTLHAVLRKQAHTVFDETEWNHQSKLIHHAFPTAWDLVVSCTPLICIIPPADSDNRLN